MSSCNEELPREAEMPVSCSRVQRCLLGQHQEPRPLCRLLIIVFPLPASSLTDGPTLSKEPLSHALQLSEKVKDDQLTPPGEPAGRLPGWAGAWGPARSGAELWGAGAKGPLQSKLGNPQNRTMGGRTSGDGADLHTPREAVKAHPL